MREHPPVITSAKHPEAVALRKLLRRPQRCRRQGLFVLDGPHLFEEALGSAHQAAFILATERFLEDPARAALVAGLRARGWPLRPVAEPVLAGLAPTEHPQGILGAFRRPAAADLAAPAAGAGLAARPGIAGLVLTGLQDPGNLGALARTAFALGCNRLVTTAGTVDPYHARALRGSSGALLHMRVTPDLAADDLLARLRAREPAARLAALVARGGAWPPRIDDPARVYLVLGSEGAGVDPALEDHCAWRWTIPMRPEAESLGVAAAGAIALYAALFAAQG